MGKQLILDNVKVQLNGCWEWQNSLDKDGYGQLMIDKKMYKPHRVAAYLWHGFNFESDKWILHHCDNPPCCNPEHLYIGNAKQNAQDRQRRGRSNSVIGSNHGLSKLREVDVLEIRKLLSEGVRPGVLAKQFKVSAANITKIKQNRGWKKCHN